MRTLHRLWPAGLIAVALASPAPVAAQASPETLRAQVTASERAFARSMAQRDLAAFVSHLSERERKAAGGG